MEKIIRTKKSKAEAIKYLEDFLNEYAQNEHVFKMKDSPHHALISAYTHSIRVVHKCIDLVNRYHLKVNFDDLLLGALLHDFYLYDFHEHTSFKNGLIHPSKAAENAKKYFNVNKHVYKMINSHMFPLLFWKIPTSREAWVLTIADKLVATRELFTNK